MFKREWKEKKSETVQTKDSFQHFITKDSREMGWEWKWMSSQKENFVLLIFFYMGEIETTFILCIINYIVWKEKLIKWEGESRTEIVLSVTLGIYATNT